MLHHPSHFSEFAFDDANQTYFDFLTTHNEFVAPAIDQYKGMDWKSLFIMLDFQDLTEIITYDTSEEQKILRTYLKLAG